jgi:amidophosphoribosyltransferase
VTHKENEPSSGKPENGLPTLLGARSRVDRPEPADLRDGPRDECGVFGVYAPEHDVARLAYFALFALQHRGQESAGIATCEDSHMTTQRDLGLVAQVFDERSLRALTGEMAIGHVRYSTTGGTGWENAQPVYRHDRRPVALAHNGKQINAVELYNELMEQGIRFRSTSDSEIIAALISCHPAERIEDAVAAVMKRLRGAYSTVVMTEDAVVAFRDPAGVRPLCLGRLEDRFVVASESCALDIIGADLMREVQPGELISLSERGLETRLAVESDRPAACVFEHIYFSRPDSKLEGVTLQSARGRMGEILAREAPVDADLVISVPDSGNAAAKGFARASGIPQDDGLIKNRYVARTFIQPGQELRRHGLRMKFNPLPDVIGGKRLVVVDDSIVRGNTMRQIVQMLREAGAKEVHLRMSSPPIRHPCHYGIDMPTSEEMIAHGRSVQDVAEIVGADSLAYLSLQGVYDAIGSGRETHCDACFTGDYPLEGTESANGKLALEELAVVRA